LLTTKNSCFARPATECWLILGPEKQIDSYRQPKDGHYTDHTLHGPGGRLASVAVAEFTLALDDLFAQ